MESLKVSPPWRRNPRLPSLPLAALLVLIAGAHPALAAVDLQPCSNNVPPAKQIEIGQKAAKQVYEQMPVLPDSSPVTQYVQALGKKLTDHAPGYQWPYNFHVVNVADINAFALPGGSIFVNLGTIQAADDEAQLAAVMAHEISHVVLQHSICNLEKEQRVGLLAGLGQLAAGIALGNGALGTIAQQGIGIGAGLGFLKMSRTAERQADLEGVGILYDTGYDPRAMPQFFETIQAKYGNGAAQFLSDHPNPGNRTEYVDQEISTLPRRPHPITNTPEFRRIHKLVAGMHAYTAKQVASGVWKRQSPNQTVSTGIDQYDQQAPSSNVDLSPPPGWTTFQGDGFTMQVPSTWRSLSGKSSTMIAPQGGIGMTSTGQIGNLIYGLLTNTYTPQPGASTDDAFTALLTQIGKQNPGMQAASVTTLQVDGQTAQSANSVNPGANNGRGEHDWIVAIPGSGNALLYFVFVSPQSDYSSMEPTFEHILNSVQLQRPAATQPAPSTQ